MARCIARRIPFHPRNVLAVANVGKGDVAHRGGRSCPVPMLHIWRTPDDVTGLYLVLLAASSCPIRCRCDDKRLSGRMGMPGGACARQKGDKCSCLRKMLVRAEIGIDHHGSGEVGLRPQHGLPRAVRGNFHLVGQDRRDQCREESCCDQKIFHDHPHCLPRFSNTSFTTGMAEKTRWPTAIKRRAAPRNRPLRPASSALLGAIEIEGICATCPVAINALTAPGAGHAAQDRGAATNP